MGLPAKFGSWRPKQEEAIQIALTNDKRVTAFSSPTGSGKSAINVAIALLSKKPTCIVTNSRGLQDQYMRDFKSVGMVDIRGRNNYSCSLKDGFTCDEGYASRCPYKNTVACPSSQAEMRAAVSPLVITNFDKWTASKKYGTGMSHFTQVIFDEAHDSYDALSRAMQVVLHYKEIEEKLKIEFLCGEEALEFANWKPWAQQARVTAEAEMIAARSRVVNSSDPKPSWVRHYTHMRNLSRRLATLATANAKEWIVDETDQGYQFDPIRPGKYAESALLLRVPRIVMVSATIRPKTMYMLGIGKDNFLFKEFDSDFDPKRCPIYHIPTMRVDKNAHDLSMLWVRLDQIAAKRRDRKGIVHTISYARRDEIVSRSRFADSMIVNPKGEAPSPVIDTFMNSEDGAILVSPSVGTGYDFPMQACEWQMVCKIPFPDSRSKIVQARQHEDKEYGPYGAMQNLVQAFGRAVRSKEDKAENFICDDHIQWFIKKFGHLAPKSFHAFYKQVQVVPPPPERLPR